MFVNTDLQLITSPFICPSVGLCAIGAGMGGIVLRSLRPDCRKANSPTAAPAPCLCPAPSSGWVPSQNPLFIQQQGRFLTCSLLCVRNCLRSQLSPSDLEVTLFRGQRERRYGLLRVPRMPFASLFCSLYKTGNTSPWSPTEV